MVGCVWNMVSGNHNKRQGNVSGRDLNSVPQSPLLLSHTVSGCGMRNLTDLPRTMQNDQNMNDFTCSVYLRAVRSPQPVFIYCYSSCILSSPHYCVFHNAVLHISSSNTSECFVLRSERDTRLSKWSRQRQTTALSRFLLAIADAYLRPWEIKRVENLQFK